jgi:hypothetical protein
MADHKGTPIKLDASTQLISVTEIGKDIVVTSINEYKGKKGLDVRRYYEDENGAYAPTGKGVRIPIEQAEGFVKGLNTAFGKKAKA